MLISYKWLKELVDFNIEADKLEPVLTMLGIEVESIIDYNSKYKGFFTAEVIEKEKHPDADKLSVCKVQIGNEIKNVVCGAPNVGKGQKVVLGTIGAKVPNGGITLEKRAVRKVVSEGMICSQTELDLGDDQSGIWVLPDDTPQGIPLSEYLQLDDVVLEISVTPNRADCLSHLGLARLISAYCGTLVKKPVINLIETNEQSSDYIKINIEDNEKCPRYTGRVIKNINVSESPEWLKQRLILCGMRPINIIVDITNYVLLECGQPLHAFDLDKLAKNQIIIKTASQKDKFTTLDSKERNLDSSMLMICDGEKAVAVGGVMGGENSEISLETKNILIESAYFNPPSIRRTAKILGISSESSYRFERGVDPDNVDYANNRASQLVAELAGGQVLKGLIDVYSNKIENKRITLRFERAEKIIGAKIEKEKMCNLLESLGFIILEKNSEAVLVEVPSYRIDIFEEIDLIEEIAILNNYDDLDAQFVSSVTFERETLSERLIAPKLRKNLKDYLIANGFNEILTQNITDPTSAGKYSSDLIHISNPLGEEMSVMRPSLIPSVLKTIERNIRMGNPNQKLFETGNSYHRIESSADTFIPGIKEQEELIIALTGKNLPVQWSGNNHEYDFYDIKGIFENLSKFFRFKALKLSEYKDELSVFSPNSLKITYKGDEIGVFGELSKKYLKSFDIEQNVLLLTMNLDKVYKLPPNEVRYSPVSAFPGSKRDLAFIVDKSIQSGDISNLISSVDKKILKMVELFDLFEGKNLGEGKKSLAFSLHFSSIEKTLTDDEIDSVIKKAVSSVEQNFNAQLRK